MAGEKGGNSGSTRKILGDLCVIAVLEMGLYAPMVLGFKFPKEYPVAAVCFCDCAGGGFISLHITQVALCYT